jgi:hypothetical protein
MKLPTNSADWPTPLALLTWSADAASALGPDDSEALQPANIAMAAPMKGVHRTDVTRTLVIPTSYRQLVTVGGFR